MARNGTSSTISISPGTTAGTTLRNFQAVNLTVPTVGAEYQFDAASSSLRRNYWTLTYPISGMEIMFCVAEGTTRNTGNLYVDRNTIHGTWTQGAGIVMAPDGGLEDALVNGFDPDTSAFVDHITTTLGFRQPTEMTQIVFFRAGGGSFDFLHIEDDANESLCFYSYDSASIASDFCSIHVFSPELYNDYPSTGASQFYSPEGHYFIQGQNTTVKEVGFVNFTAWERVSNDRNIEKTGTGVSHINPEGGFNAVPATALVGDLAAWRTPVIFSDSEVAFVDPIYLKMTSFFHTPYREIRGNTTDYKYMRLIRRYLTPWDNAETAPA